MLEEIFVNSVWVGLPDGTVVGPGMVIGTNAFGTIQEGVNAAPIQGTVQVAAGTYNETVTINQPVQVHGAQYGVDARTRFSNPTGESIVQGDMDTGVFYVLAEYVVIDGFTIQNNTLGPGLYAKGDESSGYWFFNNIIQNNTIGIYLNSNGSVESLVQQNYINNNNQTGPSGGNGIYSDQGASNIIVDNNILTNNQGSTLIGADASPFTDVVFSNNEMTADGGFYFLTCQNISLQNNNISNNLFDAIALAGANDRITIVNNIFHNNVGYAIDVVLQFVEVLNSNIRAKHNSIMGNVAGGLNVDAGSYTDAGDNLPLDATNNWWGDPSGPNVNAGGPGTGQTITDPDGVTIYTPFLTSEPFAPSPLITPVQRIASNAANVYVAPDRGTAVTAAILGTGTLAVEVPQFNTWPNLLKYINDNNPVLGLVNNAVQVWSATTAPGQTLGFASATSAFTLAAQGQVLISLTAFADNAMQAQIDLVNADTQTVISTPPLGVLLLDGSMDPTPVILVPPFNWQNIRCYSITTGVIPAGNYQIVVSFTAVNYDQYLSFPNPAGLAFVADVYASGS